MNSADIVIGNRIRKAREHNNLTQKALAELLGVQPQTVWRWEKGERAPWTSQIIKLAEALGTTISFLLGEKDLLVRPVGYVSFVEWVAKQKKRDDVVGDIAEDVLSDERFPIAVDTYKEYIAYIKTKTSDAQVISAAKEAWKEYTQYLGQRKKSPARLVYERPDGERLELPATPEGYALFEKLVVAMMTESLKEELSSSPHSVGAVRSA